MSARRPTPAEARERRAKIAAVVLTVVFVAVCAIQVPRVLKHFESSSSDAAATTTTTPAPPAAAPAVLVSARTTHLSRLGRFAWKDPFRQQLQPKAAAPATAKPKPPAEKSKPTPKPKPPAPVTASAPPAQTKSFTPLPARPKPAQKGRPGVLLRLDGKRLGLLRGDLFPAADPVFRLVSFTKKTARVALIAGTLSDGGSTLKLEQGHELVLRNATTGDRYVLELVRPARVVPRAGAAKPKA